VTADNKPVDNKPVCLVDDREPPWAIERLSRYGLLAVSSHLQAGDYMFFPHGMAAVIERKTVSNLLGSMSTRQIVTQAHRMLEINKSLPILLVEGQYSYHPGGNLQYLNPKDPRSNKEGWVISEWSWDSFTGMMLDLQAMGLILHHCPIYGEFPKEIARLVVNLSKENHVWIRERERPTVMAASKQYRNAIWALSAFDGIGPETAEALLAEFGTVYNLTRKLVEETESVAGFRVGRARIGKKMENLRKELLRSYARG